MTDLTKKQIEILLDLRPFAQKAMRSKPVLRELSKMMDQGLIEYDPFAGSAKLTATGLDAIAKHREPSAFADWQGEQDSANENSPSVSRPDTSQERV